MVDKIRQAISFLESKLPKNSEKLVSITSEAFRMFSKPIKINVGNTETENIDRQMFSENKRLKLLE